MKQNKLVTFGIILFLGIILLTALSNSIFKTIQSGEAGIVFKRFGGGLDTEHIKGQGFHVIAPWNTLIVYNIQTKEAFEKMSVLSKKWFDHRCRFILSVPTTS